MTRSARRRAAPTARLQARARRRAGHRAEATRRALPLLVDYLDAVADALRDVGLTVLEVNAWTDAAGLRAAISLGASSSADHGPDEPGAPDAQPDDARHGAAPPGRSLVWTPGTGWSLATGRAGRGGRARYLHPDRTPDPVGLARVVRAVLAGRLVATPVGPPDLPREQDLPALLHALARRAGRRR